MLKQRQLLLSWRLHAMKLAGDSDPLASSLPELHATVEGLTRELQEAEPLQQEREQRQQQAADSAQGGAD